MMDDRHRWKWEENSSNEGTQRKELSKNILSRSAHINTKYQSVCCVEEKH